MLSLGPAPGRELEAGKGDVEMGRDDSETTTGGEAGREAAAQTQQESTANLGKLVGRTACP